MTKVQDVIKYIPHYRNNTLILLRFTTLWFCFTFFMTRTLRWWRHTSAAFNPHFLFVSVRQKSRPKYPHARGADRGADNDCQDGDGEDVCTHAYVVLVISL